MRFAKLFVTSITVFWSSVALAQHGTRAVKSASSTGAERAFVIRWRTESALGANDEQVRVSADRTNEPISLDQQMTLDASGNILRLVRIIPRAARSQAVIPDAQGNSPPAIQLTVESGGQVDSAWLLSDSPTRNRLNSLIAHWRYASAANQTERDALFDSFKAELTRPPTVIVTANSGGEPKTVLAQRGKQLAFSALDCVVRVKDFMPHFAIDKATNEPVNQSNERVNPAALVEIEYRGKKTERWVFSRFPDWGAPAEGTYPVRVVLDSTLEASGKLPSFLIVTTAPDKHELWVRGPREHEAIPLSLDQKVPIRGTSYTFNISRFVPSAELVEAYSPSESRNSVAVLEFEHENAAGVKTTYWVELKGRVRVDLPTGALLVNFQTPSASAGVHGASSH
jgi:hypothetical protein